MPWRQRVRGGERDAPAVPGGAAQLALGGRGQHQQPRRVLRVLARQADALAALLAEVAPARAAEPRLDREAAALERLAASPDPVGLPGGARRLVERLAVVLQGALLVRHGHPAVADAFCASPGGRRPGGRVRHTLPGGLDLATIVERATPKAG